MSAMPSSEMQVSSLARSAGSRAPPPSVPDSPFDWGEAGWGGKGKDPAFGDCALSTVSHLNRTQSQHPLPAHPTLDLRLER
jgi:hypothetical protein